MKELIAALSLYLFFNSLLFSFFSFFHFIIVNIMTQEEFKALGTAQHYKILAEWGGKKWRLTKTVQATKTCFLNGVNGRMTKKSIATSYERVTIIDNLN